MSLPKAFLDELRARVPLSDVIGKRTKLTRAGREFKACCPFHKEKSPSFYVNDQKGFYHCFGCGAHGDIVGFLMNHDNYSFMDAVEHLAGLAGMEVPKPSPAEQQKFQRQMSLYDLMEQAAKWYEQQLHLPQNKKILQYLIDRGLSLQTIKTFRLGFSPMEGELKSYLQKSNYRIDDMVEAGLFKMSERQKGDAYPFFRGRVMFPVQDLQGRVVAFGARVLPESHGGPPDKSAPKYINSPETPIYHKGRMLYNLSRSRKAIGEGERVVVVEGYMDVIALAQAGFQAAVAPLGTALTETQIEEIWRTMPEDGRNPVLCFDGDKAGQRAASRALERVLPILKPDHSVKFSFLPEEHDPDSLIKAEGAASMRKVLDNAIGIFDMMWQEEAEGRNFTQPEEKAGFRSGLEKRARQISNMTVQEFFIHEIQQKINQAFFGFDKQRGQSGGASQKWSSGGFKGKGRIPVTPGAHSPYRPSMAAVKPIKSSRLQREKVLLATAINHPMLYDEFAEDLGMLAIPNVDYDNVKQELKRFLGAQHEAMEIDEIYLDDQAVKQHLISCGYAKILDAIFDRSLYLHASFAKPGQPDDLVRQGWRDTYARVQENARRV